MFLLCFLFFLFFLNSQNDTEEMSTLCWKTFLLLLLSSWTVGADTNKEHARGQQCTLCWFAPHLLMCQLAWQIWQQIKLQNETAHAGPSQRITSLPHRHSVNSNKQWWHKCHEGSFWICHEHSILQQLSLASCLPHLLHCNGHCRLWPVPVPVLCLCLFHSGLFEVASMGNVRAYDNSCLWGRKLKCTVLSVKGLRSAID